MSVQVKRRRESASFLSGFVGAQGELLVDTTNNRIQVHDGATPGGWPAAGIGDLPGRNAVINGNFSINQRVYASAMALAAATSAHDRWKAGSGGCTYAFSQSVPDTSVAITAGTLVQAVDAPNVYATSYWLTWTGTATARVWQNTPSGTFAAGTATKVGGVTVNALLVSNLAIGVVANLEFSPGMLGLVQFEAALPNALPTRFERRHGELLLCQRYFETRYFTILASAAGLNSYAVVLVYLSPKRVTPTIVFFNMTSNACATPSLAAAFRDSGIFIYTQSTNASGGFQATGQFTANAEV